MKIAVTGYDGNIGSRLVKMGLEPLRCDITNPKDVEESLYRVKPDLVLHLAAVTDVEWCESHYDDAVAVNTFGTSALCEKADDIIGEGRVVLLSTDHVFDGQVGYYSEDDDPSPINNYGLTKLAAEGVVHLYGGKVIRISRCFDANSRDILEYIEILKRGERVTLPKFSRSYCHMDLIAKSILLYANRFEEMPETLHIAGNKPVSMPFFVGLLAQKLFLDWKMVEARESVGGFAPRPFLGGLNTNLAKSLGIPIYTLEESLQRFADGR